MAGLYCRLLSGTRGFGGDYPTALAWFDAVASWAQENTPAGGRRALELHAAFAGRLRYGRLDYCSASMTYDRRDEAASLDRLEELIATLWDGALA